MKLLNKSATLSLKLMLNRNSVYETPLREMFESLKVGQSMCFAQGEWRQFYRSTTPHSTLHSWAKTRGWNVDVKRISGSSVAKKVEYEWMVIRTK